MPIDLKQKKTGKPQIKTIVHCSRPEFVPRVMLSDIYLKRDGEENWVNSVATKAQNRKISNITFDSYAGSPDKEAARLQAATSSNFWHTI